MQVGSAQHAIGVMHAARAIPEAPHAPQRLSALLAVRDALLLCPRSDALHTALKLPSRGSSFTKPTAYYA